MALGETKWPGAQSLSPEDNRAAYTSTLKDYARVCYVLSTEQGT